jgi:hypothetical protein
LGDFEKLVSFSDSKYHFGLLFSERLSGSVTLDNVLDGDFGAAAPAPPGVLLQPAH